MDCSCAAISSFVATLEPSAAGKWTARGQRTKRSPHSPPGLWRHSSPATDDAPRNESLWLKTLSSANGNALRRAGRSIRLVIGREIRVRIMSRISRAADLREHNCRLDIILSWVIRSTPFGSPRSKVTQIIGPRQISRGRDRIFLVFMGTMMIVPHEQLW